MDGTAARREPCLGKIFLTWSLYGIAVAWVWRALQGQPWGDALTWALALAAAGLLLAAGRA